MPLCVTQFLLVLGNGLFDNRATTNFYQQETKRVSAGGVKNLFLEALCFYS